MKKIKILVMVLILFIIVTATFSYGSSMDRLVEIKLDNEVINIITDDVF